MLILQLAPPHPDRSFGDPLDFYWSEYDPEGYDLFFNPPIPTTDYQREIDRGRPLADGGEFTGY